MKKEEFSDLIKKGPLLLDGATGSNLYLAGMPRGVSSEAWVLEHPDVMNNLQKAYIEAGSRIVYAPTFGANRHSLQSFGIEVDAGEMNKRLLDISRKAAGDKAFVAGDVSPTSIASTEEEAAEKADEIFSVYSEQIQALYEAGADLIVVETMLLADEAAIALDAAASVCDLPVMCTLTVQADGRTYYGSEAASSAAMFAELGAAAVGVNCSVGPDQLESVIRSIAREVDIPVIAKPNAGLPRIDEAGNAVYDMSPLEFAAGMMKLKEAGACVLGGCCGTTPEYIRALALALEGRKIIL